MRKPRAGSGPGQGPDSDDAVPRHAVTTFWLIATALEVALAVALLLTGADRAIERGLAATGMEFNTDLVSAARLVAGYPAAAVGVLLALAQVAAPDLAVLLVTRRAARGPASLAAVAARFRFAGPGVSRRAGLVVWAQLVLTFLGLNLATAALNSVVLGDTEWRWNPHLISWTLPAALLVTMFLDAGAVLEENGWRGYALPLLLRRRSPVAASVLLGLAWAAWHYPVKYDALLDGPGGIGYLAAFTLKIVLLSVVITYFWQRLGGSTIAAIAMHGLSNDSMRLQGLLIGDSTRLSILSELTICLPLACVAGWLVWRTRGALR